jgi:hypothetical protein
MSSAPMNSAKKTTMSDAKTASIVVSVVATVLVTVNVDIAASGIDVKVAVVLLVCIIVE